MNVLFLQRTGLDLYSTLLASETSRRILMFYHPASYPGGISVSVSSFGSALSLAGELRWYIRRYMQDVLLEVSRDRYCTLELGRELYYDRDFTIDDNWPFRCLYVIRNGNLASIVNLSAFDDPGSGIPGGDQVNRLIVLCSEREYNGERSIGRGEETESGEACNHDEE
jgi:hypothetical protein